MEYAELHLTEQARQSLFDPSEVEAAIERERAELAHVKEMQAGAQEKVEAESVRKILADGFAASIRISEKYLQSLESTRQEKMKHREALLARLAKPLEQERV